MGKIVVLLWVDDRDDACCSCALLTLYEHLLLVFTWMESTIACCIKAGPGHPGAAIMDSPQSPNLSPVIQVFGVSGRTRFSESMKTFKCDIKIKCHMCCFSPLTPTENTNSSFPPPVKSAQQKCITQSQQDNTSYQQDVAYIIPVCG